MQIITVFLSGPLLLLFIHHFIYCLKTYRYFFRYIANILINLINMYQDFISLLMHHINGYVFATFYVFFVWLCFNEKKNVKPWNYNNEEEVGFFNLKYYRPVFYYYIQKTLSRFNWERAKKKCSLLMSIYLICSLRERKKEILFWLYISSLERN